MRHKLLHGFTSLILALVISITGITPAQAAPPINDNFVDAEIITSLPFSTTANISEAGIEVDEPQPCSNWGKSIWYTYTPTQTMSVRVATTFNVNAYRASGPGFDGLSFQGCTYQYNGPFSFLAEAGQTYYLQAEGTGNIQINLEQLIPPGNDNFADAEVISSLPFSTTVNVTNAGIETGEPLACPYSQKTAWYSFTPTENTSIRVTNNYNLTVYRANGPGLENLIYQSCNNNNGYVNFLAEANQTYYLQVDGFGSISIDLEQLHSPANDAFVAAEPITVLPFNETIDVTDAFTEINEPQNCYPMPNTVWYSFTPTQNTLVRADTQGSAINANLNIYRAGTGIHDLQFLNCVGPGSSSQFLAEVGQIYYLQVGAAYGPAGTIQVNLEQLPLPANDDFANATLVSLPLPFDHTVDTQYSTRQTGEPTPSCAYYGPGSRSVWYAFTPATSGSFSASIFGYAFTPVFATYTGSSMENLTQIGCQTYTGNALTFHANAGTTYYFQVGNLYYWEQGGSMQFHLDVTPPPQASFYYYPGDPSKYDTIQFQDSSYDPGNVGFQTFTWNFGDGTTANGYSATHKYTTDGDYQVTHTVTTVDGRTASITQTVQVRTHDVAITKITTPASANVGQTKTITVTLRNIAYPETVQIDLYKSTPNGFVWVATVTRSVPTLSGNRTTAVNFSYTFTSDDARLGKVTFKAVATLVGARDAYPSDNEAISLITKVAR